MSESSDELLKMYTGPIPRDLKLVRGIRGEQGEDIFSIVLKVTFSPTFKNIRIIPESSCMLVPRLCQSSHPQSKPLLTFFSRHRLVLPLLELHTTKSCIAWFVRKLLAFMRLCALVVCSFLLSVTLYGYAIVYPLICCWWTLRLFPVLFGLFWINLLGTFLWHMLSFLLNCWIIG